MPSYAGAKLAMRDRFLIGWADRTPVNFQNERPAQAKPMNVRQELVPWVLFEVIGSGAPLKAIGGRPGNLRWNYEGNIVVNVFVPVGAGDDEATEHAVIAGEIFRAAKFYDEVQGFYVRTLAPSIDDGGSGDDKGVWFRCSMMCDFTYRHLG